jgi:hypothetical protein
MMLYLRRTLVRLYHYSTFSKAFYQADSCFSMYELPKAIFVIPCTPNCHTKLLMQGKSGTPKA